MLSLLNRSRSYYKVARNALTSDLEYRSNYYIMILSSFITIAMELAIFKQIYKHTSQAGDLHVSQAASFIVLGMIVRTGSVIWSLIKETIDQIRDGSFRRFLLQPIHFPSFFMAKVIGPKLVTWTLCFITLVILKFFPSFDTLLPSGTLINFLLALVLSYMITWGLYLSIVYLGFWFEEASFLMIAFNIGIGFFSGSMIPLSWMPNWVVSILKFTPAPLLGDFPIRAGLGTLSSTEFFNYLLTAFFWLFMITIINSILSKKAYRSYESYGG